MNTCLYQEAVSADTGLAGIAEFTDHRAFYRALYIGIVKHDKGRVAAQFQGYFLNMLGALSHQLAAHTGGAGEAQLAYRRAAGKHVADNRRLAGHHVEHACRDARFIRQFC